MPEVKKIAVIIPVYPPHFMYAKEFAKDFYKYKFDKQAELFFVFSNKEDSDKFGDVCVGGGENCHA